MSKAERVFTLVMAQGFNALINFLFLPYLVRILNRNEYGTYGQVLMVADTARTLFSMGMATVLYVRLGRSQDRHSDFRTILFSAAGQGAAGCVLVFLASGFLGRFFHSNEVGPLLRIYCLYMLFYIPYLSLNALLIFLGHARASLFLVTAGLLLRVGIVVASIHLFHSLSFTFAGLVLLGAIQLGMALACVPREYLKQGRFSSREAVMQLRLSAQLGLTDLLGFVFLYTDDFMVSSLLSVGDYAVYRNGTIDLPVIGTLYSSIGTIVLPTISKYCEARQFEQIAQLKRKLIATTAAVIYPVVFFLIVFNKTLVCGYFSPRYSGSAPVFAIMSVVLFFRVNDYYDILVSMGRTRVLIVTYVAAVAFNALANWVLVTRFGYVGAALGTLATWLMIIPAFYLASAWVIGMTWRAFLDLPRLAAISGVSAALPLLFYFFGPHTERLTPALVYGAISVLLSYAVFLRAGILDYRVVSPLVRKLPGVGSLVDGRLSSVFSVS